MLLKALCEMREKDQETTPPSEQEPVDDGIVLQAAGEADELIEHPLMR